MSITTEVTKSVQSNEIVERAQALADHLTRIHQEQWNFARKSGEHFAVETPRKGQKYFRIVQVYGGHSSGQSVHAFVEIATGKLIKSAGWKSPAKRTNGELQSKFNLLDDASFAEAIAKADTCGAYLYARP